MAMRPDLDRLRTLEIEELRRQLGDAQDALRAIRAGEVDALVVQTRDGARLFALESAFEPYRVFVENMQEGAAALTPDGLVLYANQRLADITGVPPAQLLGASIYEILGEPHRAVVEGLLGDLATGLRESEIVLTRGDGHTLHTYFSVTVMPDGTRCAVVTDLTERVRLRQVLASRELLRVTLASIGDAVICCDVMGGITFLNPLAEALTGWSEQEALGQPLPEVFRIVNELTHEPDEDLIARALREGTVVTLAHQTALIRRDGREVSIEDSAAPIRDGAGHVAGAVLVFHDVTQRRAAEGALARSQARLEHVLNSITDGFYALDAGWRFVSANHTAERHFGRPASELFGRTFWEVTAAGPDSVHGRSYLQAIGTGAAVHFEAPSASRPDQWAEFHAYPHEGGVEVYFADISTRKNAEESLKRALADVERAKLSADGARAAAEQANRAKDRFLAVLSHELRTPLSPVLMNVSLLEADEALSPRARKFIDVIRRNVLLESRLIDDLLDLTDAARGTIQMNRQAVDLSAVITRVVEVCRPDIGARGLNLDLDFGRQPARLLVEADARRLRQIVSNLLENAIKFTSRGGRLGLLCREENGQAVIEVTDSGIGIEPAMVPRVFDGFSQAEPSSLTRQFGGLGLGLAITRTLVELHGGTIEAHSEGRGKGAMFRVCLPLLRVEPRAAPAHATPETPPARVPKLRVLLVDDDGETTEMLGTILEMEGHEVRTAANVAKALETAAQVKFDLLVSDLGLPDGSGLDLMRELRARGSELPGIALSGYGQETDVRQSLAAGFSEHLVKPADPEVLLQSVEKVVRRPPSPPEGRS